MITFISLAELKALRDRVLQLENDVVQAERDKIQLQDRLAEAMDTIDHLKGTAQPHVSVNWKQLKPFSIERTEDRKATCISYFREGAVDAQEILFFCCFDEHLKLKGEFEEWKKSSRNT